MTRLGGTALITSDKSPLFIRAFTRHIEARLRRQFGGVRLTGLTQARDALQRGPVLFVANHSSWWDGLVVAWLGHRVLPHDAHALMHQHRLAALPFFAWLGGLGLDAAAPLPGLRRAAHLLDRPGRGVFIFPQGRERPPGARPLRFAGGSALLARRVPALRVLPLALRYVFGAAPAPWAHVAVGPPIVEASVAAHEAAVTRLLDAQQAGLEPDAPPPEDLDLALVRRRQDDGGGLGGACLGLWARRQLRGR